MPLVSDFLAFYSHDLSRNMVRELSEICADLECVYQRNIAYIHFILALGADALVERKMVLTF